MDSKIVLEQFQQSLLGIHNKVDFLFCLECVVEDSHLWFLDHKEEGLQTLYFQTCLPFIFVFLLKEIYFSSKRFRLIRNFTEFNGLWKVLFWRFSFYLWAVFYALKNYFYLIINFLWFFFIYWLWSYELDRCINLMLA